MAHAHGGGAGTGWAGSIRHVLDRLEAAGDLEEALSHAAVLQRYSERLVAEVVAQARTSEPPLSWARIGSCLGISRQAANERFSPVGQDGALHRRYRRARRTQAQREAAAQA